MLALWLLALLLSTAFLAHRRTAPLPALGMVAGLLILMGVFSHAPVWLMGLFWLLLLVVALPLLLPQQRRSLFTAPLFAWFKRVLPPMSATERDAIEAGTVWWDGELFSGRPDWDTLLAYPKAQLTEEEQAFIDGPTEELCAMVSDWQIGGKGFSAYAPSQVAMKLATRSGDLASTVMVPNSLGPAELLLHYGTDAQRDHYLPRLARGEDIPCFALTGPLAGSDAGAMPDTGIICKGQWQGE